MVQHGNKYALYGSVLRHCWKKQFKQGTCLHGTVWTFIVIALVVVGIFICSIIGYAAMFMAGKNMENGCYPSEETYFREHDILEDEWNCHNPGWMTHHNFETSICSNIQPGMCWFPGLGFAFAIGCIGFVVFLIGEWIYELSKETQEAWNTSLTEIIVDKGE